MENKTLSADPLLLLIWRNRKLFILVAVLAAGISSVAAFMVPVKFKAVASMFPGKSNSLPLGDRLLPPSGVELFGAEGEGERMLAVLGSNPVRSKIIDKFNLFKHYEIDLKSPSKNDQMARTYADHIHFDRTRFGSVDIVVWDRNPDTAAMIANELADSYDEANNDMIHANAKQSLQTMEREYELLQSEIKLVTDTMTSLRSMGVVGEEEALAALLERQTIAQQKGGKFAEDVNKIIDNNNKFGSVYFSFYQRLGFMMKRLELLKGNLDQVRSDANTTMSHRYMVEYAAPPDKKAYPVRWLLVTIATFTSLFFLLALLIIFQKYKQLKTVR